MPVETATDRATVVTLPAADMFLLAMTMTCQVSQIGPSVQRE